MKFAFVLIGAIALGGCAVASTAGNVVEAGAGLGVGAVKVTGRAAGKTAGALTPGGDPHRDRDDDPRPYDANRDAMADVDRALAAARANNTNAVIVLGGNWCHDSRGLAAKFEARELAALIEERYELVYVDVGYRDRNLDVARRLGVDELYGTPTVLIVSGAGALLNRESVHDWRTADSKPYGETLAYFQRYAAMSGPGR